MKPGHILPLCLFQVGTSISRLAKLNYHNIGRKIKNKKMKEIKEINERKK